MSRRTDLFEELAQGETFKKIVEKYSSDAVPDGEGGFSICSESLKDELQEEIMDFVLFDFLAFTEDKINEACREPEDRTAEEEYKRSISR